MGLVRGARTAAAGLRDFAGCLLTGFVAGSFLREIFAFRAIPFFRAPLDLAAPATLDRRVFLGFMGRVLLYKGAGCL